MGNCASDPKTNEGDAPEPEPVEEVKVEQNGETKEETPKASDDKSLGTLLSENVEKGAGKVEVEAKEENPKEEKVEAEPKEEKVEAKEEKPNEEKAEAKEEKPKA